MVTPSIRPSFTSNTKVTSCLVVLAGWIVHHVLHGSSCCSIFLVSSLIVLHVSSVCSVVQVLVVVVVWWWGCCCSFQRRYVTETSLPPTLNPMLGFPPKPPTPPSQAQNHTQNHPRPKATDEIHRQKPQTSQRLRGDGEHRQQPGSCQGSANGEDVWKRQKPGAHRGGGQVQCGTHWSTWRLSRVDLEVQRGGILQTSNAGSWAEF